MTSERRDSSDELLLTSRGSSIRHRPGCTSLAVVVRRLPELVDAVTKALAKARELGLIDDDRREGAE